MRRLALALLVGLVAAGLVVGVYWLQHGRLWPVAGLTRLPPPPEAASDPALYNPLFANMFRERGATWEQGLTPELQRRAEWQRKVGKHAVIFGDSVGKVDLGYDASYFVVTVGDWDQTDLFALGLPRTFEGRSVVVVEDKSTLLLYFGYDR